MRYDRPNTEKSPKSTSVFRSYKPAIVFLIPNMLIFLESWGLGQTSPASEFLILGYGKKSNLRGGTSNLSIKSKRSKIGTIMFRSGQGVKWYQVCWDSTPTISEVILKKPPVPIVMDFSLVHRRRQICRNPVWQVGYEGSRSKPERSEGEHNRSRGLEPTQPNWIQINLTTKRWEQTDGLIESCASLKSPPWPRHCSGLSIMLRRYCSLVPVYVHIVRYTTWKHSLLDNAW